MRKISKIILHCSDTEEGKDFRAADIDTWHKQRGWKGIGYHYVIDIDGKVERGRQDSVVGAHCEGHNKDSIGICYIGGKNKSGKYADTRTESQKSAMLDLVYLLLEQYNLNINNVYGHYQFAVRECPCFKIETFKKEYKEAFG